MPGDNRALVGQGVAAWLRELPSRLRHRGQTRLTYVLDCLLRSNEENIYRVGSVQFPFLYGEDQREMFYGLFERQTASFLRRWLRLGDVFIDVGANVGYFTALACNCVGPIGEVHAFEPEPAHFTRLHRLAELNPDCRIITNMAAVDECDGIANLYVSPHAGWHTIVQGFNQQRFGYEKIIEVPCTSLDSYLARRPVEKIRLVKIDVEGAEGAVLRGSTRILGQGIVDAFLVEVTPPDPDAPIESVSRIFEKMQIARYQAYNGSEGGNTWKPVRAHDIRVQTMVLWSRLPPS